MSGRLRSESPALYSGAPGGSPRGASILRLLSGLIDADRDREGLIAAALAGAPHGRGAEVIEADGAPHVGIGRADAVGRVEADPADVGHEGFGPGVAGFLEHDAVG